MPSMFIRVEVEPEAAADRELAKKLVEVCPVNIFDLDGEGKLEAHGRQLSSPGEPATIRMGDCRLDTRWAISSVG